MGHYGAKTKLVALTLVVSMLFTPVQTFASWVPTDGDPAGQGVADAVDPPKDAVQDTEAPPPVDPQPEPQPPAAVCLCVARCTEQGANGDCPLCQNDVADCAGAEALSPMNAVFARCEALAAWYDAAAVDEDGMPLDEGDRVRFLADYDAMMEEADRLAGDADLDVYGALSANETFVRLTGLYRLIGAYEPKNLASVPTVSGATVYANGTPIWIMENGTGGTKVCTDAEGKQVVPNGQTLQPSSTIYGGGATPLTGDTNITMLSGSVSGIFGGGSKGGGVTGNATITVSGGKLPQIYGGGSASSVTGKRTINISGGTVDTIYAGNTSVSAQDNADGEINISGGTITGSIYGTGNGGGATGPDAQRILNLSGDPKIGNKTTAGIQLETFTDHQFHVVGPLTDLPTTYAGNITLIRGKLPRGDTVAEVTFGSPDWATFDQFTLPAGIIEHDPDKKILRISHASLPTISTDVNWTVISGNGAPLLITDGIDGDPNTTTIYWDKNGDGKLDPREPSLREISTSFPQDDTDLSGLVSISGGYRGSYNGNTKITMTGGNVTSLYGAMYSGTQVGNAQLVLTGGTCGVAFAAGGRIAQLIGTAELTIGGTATVSRVLGDNGRMTGTVTINIRDDATITTTITSSTYEAGAAISSVLNISGGTIKGRIAGSTQPLATFTGSHVLNISGNPVIGDKSINYGIQLDTFTDKRINIAGPLTGENGAITLLQGSLPMGGTVATTRPATPAWADPDKFTMSVRFLVKSTDETSVIISPSSPPTVSGQIVFSNGSPLLITGTSDTNSTIYWDKDDSGTISDGDLSLRQINATYPADGSNLTGYSIFGGYQILPYEGNTKITMISGRVATVMGGGFSATAPVTGNTLVTVSGGSVTSTVAGGGSNGNKLTGNTQVIFSGGQTQYVFGGAQGASNVTGNTNATVSGGTVTLSVCGGGSANSVVTGTATLNISGGTIPGMIYGGNLNSNTGAGPSNRVLNLSGNPVVGDKGTANGIKLESFTDKRIKITGELTGGDGVITLVQGGLPKGSTVAETQPDTKAWANPDKFTMSARYLAKSTDENSVIISQSSPPTFRTPFVYANGSPLLITGTSATSSTIYWDRDNSGTVTAGDLSLRQINAAYPADGADLSNYGVMGGFISEAYQGDTKITMISGKVGSLIGGGSASGSPVTGDTYIAVSGGTCSTIAGGGYNGSVVTGETHVVFTGGTCSNISGGGHNNSAHTGNTNVTVSGGTVTGNVSGGGSGSGMSENVTGTATITISGGTILGTVYGGKGTSSIGAQVGKSILNLSGDPKIGSATATGIQLQSLTEQKVNITGKLTGTPGGIQLVVKNTDFGTVVAECEPDAGYADFEKFKAMNTVAVAIPLFTEGDTVKVSTSLPPTVVGNAIYGNGTALVIQAGGDGTTVYIDTNRNGVVDAAEKSLKAATPAITNAPLDNANLSGWTIYGGSASGTLICDTMITMLGGSVAALDCGNAAGSVAGSSRLDLRGGTVAGAVTAGTVSGTKALKVSGNPAIGNQSDLGIHLTDFTDAKLLITGLLTGGVGAITLTGPGNTSVAGTVVATAVDVTHADAGKFTLKGKNLSVEDGHVIISVAPTVSVLPAAKDLIYGYASSEAGSLTATATVPVGYTITHQWYQSARAEPGSGTIISGATNSSFPLPEGLNAGSIHYYCVVTAKNPVGRTASAASEIVTVTVAPRPAAFTWTSGPFFYNGQAQTITAAVSNAVGGDVVTAVCTYDTDSKSAGTHTATVSALSGASVGNYTLDGAADAQRKYVIQKVTLHANYRGESIPFGTTPLLAVEVNGFIPGESAEGDTRAAGFVMPTFPVPVPTAVGAHHLTPAGGAADNYAFVYEGGPLLIVAATMTGVTAADGGGTYDGTQKSIRVDLVGAALGATVTYNTDGGTSYTDKKPEFRNVGDYPVYYKVSKPGYKNIFGVAHVRIGKNPLTLAATVEDKTYDGTVAATGVLAPVGVVDGDVVTATGSIAFATKDAGKNKPVHVSGAVLSGAASGNYTVSDLYDQTSTASITPKEVTLNWVNFNTRTYDGSPSSVRATVSNLIPGDVCAVTVTGGAERNANDAHTARATALENPNYALPTAPLTQTYCIGKATLTATYIGETVIYKEKRPTLAVEVTGFVHGESAENVGEGSTYTPPTITFDAEKALVGVHTLTPAGGTATNYGFTYVSGVLHILSREFDFVDVVGYTGDYDGQPHGATITNEDDAAKDVKVAYYSNKECTEGETETPTKQTNAGITPVYFKVTAPNMTNYISETSITIHPKKVTPTLTDVVGRDYDGTMNATGTLGLIGVVAGETVTPTGTIGFINKNVGEHKAVDVKDIKITDPNYCLTTETLHVETEAAITPKPVTLTWSGHENLIYTGAAQRVTAVLPEGALVHGDTCAVTVIGGGVTDTGDAPHTATATLSSANYAATNPTQTYTIQKAELTAQYKSETIHFGTPPAKEIEVTGWVGGESAVSAAGYVAPTIAGALPTEASKTPHVITLAGGSAGNYTITLVQTGTLTILAGSLDGQVRSEGYEMPYDGQRHGITVLYPNDAAIAYYASAADRANGANALTGDAATIKAVASKTIYYRVTKENYDTVDGAETITITPKNLNVAITPDSVASRPYDGSTDTTGGALILIGVETGDTVRAEGATFTFTDGSAGNDRTVNVSGIALTGEAKGNYTVPDSLTGVATSADITPREVTLLWTGDTDLVYDGQAKYVTATAGNLIGGDACAVTVVGGVETLPGTYSAVATAVDNPNYQLPTAAAHLYTIAKASGATITAVPYEKIFDGRPHDGVTVSGGQPGDEVWYSVDSGKNWSVLVPQVGKVGETTIRIKVLRENSEDFILNVTAKVKSGPAAYLNSPEFDVTSVSTVTLSGTVTEGGYPLATQAMEYRKLGDGAWTKLAAGETNNGITQYSHALTTLAEDTGYEVRLTAADSQGNAARATQKFRTQPKVPPTGVIEGSVGGTKGPITVTLEMGNTIVASIKGLQPAPSPSSTFSFDRLPDGEYNLVATDGTYKVTRKATVKNGKTTTLEIMTIENKQSTVVVEEGAAPVAADGLNSLFTDAVYEKDTDATAAVSNGGTVEMRLTASSAQSQAEITDIKAQAPSKEFEPMLDFTLDMIVTPHGELSTVKKVTNTVTLLEIAIPLSAEAQGKSGYRAYRHHDGAVDALTLLEDDIMPTIESFRVEGGYAYLYVQKFSVYAIAYDGTVAPANSHRPSTPNRAAHMAYMVGDDRGNFRPDAGMTRAEAATLFFNLLAEKPTDGGVTFSDVPDGAWYAEAVHTLAGLAILKGRGNGAFQPDATVSRAEFTAMAARFQGLTFGGAVGGRSFEDVPATHWAHETIRAAAAEGWISGYPDGTFQPERGVSRAEAAVIVNAMLGRSPDSAYIDVEKGLRHFPDVPASHWAFYHIAEAVNNHESFRAQGVEHWVEKG